MSNLSNRTNSDNANIGDIFLLNKLLLKKSYQNTLNMNVRTHFLDKMTPFNAHLTQKA